MRRFAPRLWLTLAALSLLVSLSLISLDGTPASAQQGQGQNQGQGQGGKGKRNQEEEEMRLPSDPRLLELHRDFVLKAGKLATEYEAKKDYDKARDVCYEILKLVPRYPAAKSMLAKLDGIEATAEKLNIEIQANKTWQDTGVIIQEGKPFAISATGEWNFKLEHKLTPDGMDVPKEFRDFRLGSLIGVIDTGDPKEARPFFIGAGMERKADRSGKLYLQMHDSDHRDNAGKISVEIRGTFTRTNSKAAAKD